MKKILLLFILGTMSFGAFAQYESLLSDTTRQWNIYNSNSWHYVEEKIESYFLGQSVIHNSFDYTEMYYYDWGQRTTIGFLREDTSMGRLWFLRDTFGNSGDQLVYDLSVQVGDTVNYNLIVDSIYYNQSKKYIKLKTYSFIDYRTEFFTHQHTAYYDTVVFMEGIGTSRGFELQPQWVTFNYLYSSASDYLVCAYKDSVPIYQPILPLALYPIVGCDSVTLGMYTGIEEVETSDVVRIFPNPTSGIINLESSQEVERVEVYDLKGTKLHPEFFFGHFDTNSASPNSLSVQKKSIEGRNVEELKINLSNHKNGIYLLKLYMKSGEVFSKKVIKE